MIEVFLLWMAGLPALVVVLMPHKSK